MIRSSDKSRNLTTQAQSVEKLDGWKRVAEHLGRTIRTVQRWERELGLPVHHTGRSKGYSVFAYPSELDEWLRTQSGLDDASDTSSTPAPVAEEPSRPYSPRAHRLSRIALITACVGAALTMVVVLAVQLLEGKSADIALITFSGQQALAWSNGKMAWSYNFGQSLRPLNPGELSQEYAIQDLKGDGGKQILVAAPLRLFIEGEPSTDALYCFTARGKLLWRQDYSDRVHFGGEDCGPRWDICSLTVTGPVADRKIWTAACSHPTSVAILFRSDADGGHRTTFFVNYGHLGRLSEIQKPEGSYLLAGGINNECDCAMLAILKETGTGGRSPQTGSLVQCDHCPAGQPVRYFLFPRSEVNQVGGMAYNPVYNILVTGRHFSVMTTELAPEDPPPDWALYEFSDEWVPRSVIFSDHYWEDHRRFTAEHKIGHSLDACPERLQADHSSRVES